MGIVRSSISVSKQTAQETRIIFRRCWFYDIIQTQKALDSYMNDVVEDIERRKCFLNCDYTLNAKEG